MKGGELVGRANYVGHGKYATNLPRLTNILNIVPFAPQEKRPFSTSTDCSEKKELLEPDQKSVEWMKNIVSMVYKVGELATDTYAVTLPTSMAYSQLPEYRRLVGCEEYSA